MEEQKQTLEEYQGLPPNIDLANERVDGIKREIVKYFLLICQKIAKIKKNLFYFKLERERNIQNFLDILN